MRKFVHLSALLIAALGVTACSAGSTPGVIAKPVAKAQLPGGPGTLITYQRVAVAGLDGTEYQVMYVSENEQGRDIPVIGTVSVPDGHVPAGGFPVLTYAHPTVGMAPGCVAALAKNGGAGSVAAFVNPMLRKGFELTISDMQPAGKTLPYMVGTVAARNVIDIVRAARQLPAAHASDRYAVWGHSEGGQAAMFALKIGPGYAPGLHLAGVVASAPPSEFQLIWNQLGSLSSADRGYWLMIMFGFHVAYGSQAPLDEVLTPLGLSLESTVETKCSSAVGAAVNKYPLNKLFKADPFSVPAWKKLLLANDPGQFTSASPAPLLILQGGNDQIVPVDATKVLAAHLCANRQDLERWAYPGQSHAGVIGVYLPDMLRWLAHRFAGDSNPDSITPIAERGVSITRCP